ncbi:hypothetical protein ACFLZX_03795 [Nanoarchaeota archaeon]
MTIGYCLGIVAPYYNLVLVIVVGIMFLRLFQMKNKGVFLKPWILLFTALCIYIVEEVLTVLHIVNVLTAPRILNAIFEMIMVTLFIYLLLLQRDYLKNEGKKK